MAVEQEEHHRCERVRALVVRGPLRRSMVALPDSCARRSSLAHAVVAVMLGVSRALASVHGMARARTDPSVAAETDVRPLAAVG